MWLVNILTVNIKVNLSGIHEGDTPPADIIPGLTEVQSTVAGLDVRDGETLSWTDEVSVFKQAVSTLCHRRPGITAAA